MWTRFLVIFNSVSASPLLSIPRYSIYFIRLKGTTELHTPATRPSSDTHIYWGSPKSAVSTRSSEFQFQVIYTFISHFCSSAPTQRFLSLKLKHTFSHLLHSIEKGAKGGSEFPNIMTSLIPLYCVLYLWPGPAHEFKQTKTNMDSNAHGGIPNPK